MDSKLAGRPGREKQLQDMTRTTTGRSEIYRLARVIRGVKPGASLQGMFLGQMIADILKAEFPPSD